MVLSLTQILELFQVMVISVLLRLYLVKLIILLMINTLLVLQLEEMDHQTLELETNMEHSPRVV